MALHAAKKSLRNQLKEILRNIPAEEKTIQSEVVIKKLLENPAYVNSKRVSIYLSRDIEVDTKPILQNIFASGKECFIPKYDSKSTNMEMVKLNSLEEFESLPLTSWKIKQPSASDENHENALKTGGLDLIIVPGIGFTKEGDRIGNGKGYYDIFIKRCKELYGHNFSTIALAFREQVVPTIPTDDHDIKIDTVLDPE